MALNRDVYLFKIKIYKMTQEEAKKALNQYLKQEYDQIDLKFRIGRIHELETEGKYKARYTIMRFLNI
jgi:hypothetical protein